MLRYLTISALSLLLGSVIGYYAGKHLAANQSDEMNNTVLLHQAIHLASVCGNNLYYSNPEPSSKASRYSVSLYDGYARQANDLMTKEVRLFYPEVNLVEGLARGRDYMKSKGLSEQAATADNLLELVSKNHTYSNK